MKQKNYLVTIIYSDGVEQFLANGISKNDVLTKCRILFETPEREIVRLSCRQVIVNPTTGNYRYVR